MDIRRYFGGNPSKSQSSSNKPSSKGSNASKTDGKEPKKISRKRPSVTIASDSDEEPIPKRPIKKEKSRSVIIDDSDDELPVPPPVVKPATKKEPAKVKPEKPAPKVSPSDFFGKAPVNRSAQPVVAAVVAEQKKPTYRIPLKKEATKKSTDRDFEFEIHDDDDFAETLKALDAADAVKNKVTDTKKTVTSAKELPPKRAETPKTNGIDTGRKKTIADTRPESTSPPKKQAKSSKTPDTAPAKKKARTSPDTPKAVSAKKAGNTTAYLHYLNREGPSAPGSKEIPQGEEGCFEGLAFVITGVMESIERSDMEDLIRQYGGKVTTSLSGKTSYLIVGSRDAGVSKLAQAEAKKTKRLSEDDFLELIRSRPGKRTPGRSKPVNGLASASTTPSSSKTCSTSSSSSSKKSLQYGESAAGTPAEEKCGETSKAILTTLDVKERNEDKSKPPTPTSGSPAAASTSTSPASSATKDPDSGQSLLWVDKYKPSTTAQIIGQQGDLSNVKKLRKWLDGWHANNSGGGKSKAGSKPNKFGGGNGAIYKAALLSGPPGVGKTTSAQLVCKEAGFTYVELNASDTRSKKSLQEVVAQMIGNTSLAQYIDGNVKGAQNHCLLMDEVDGMAGNEDRGGMQELIQLIKKSKIPVICMCNDRAHMKIRSLANYCFDLKFGRPTVDQLKAAMMRVCFRENLDIKGPAVQEIVLGAGQDVRQVLHHLSMWSVKNKSLTVDEASAEAKKSKKDTKKNIFDVTRTVFSANDYKTMSIHDRSNLFFNDYSMTPLYIQENYLHVRPADTAYNSSNHLRLICQAADSICDGDLVEKLVRSGQEWGLLPLQAMFSCVTPGYFMKGDAGQTHFPSWFGNYSRTTKNNRLLSELHLHTRLSVSCNKNDLSCDYLPVLCKAMVNPLITRDLDGIPATIQIMNDYSLTRDDMNAAVGLTLWSTQTDPLSKISPKLKTAFTRAYNKDPHRNPYAITTTVTKRSSKGGGNTEEGVEEDYQESEASGEEEENDDVAADSMIKKRVASKPASKAVSKPSTSKKGATSRKKK